MNIVLTALRAPAIASAAIHGVAGACFILATLVMARALPPERFGAAVLIIALGHMGIFSGPSGVAAAVLRHDIRTDPGLLAHGAAAIVPAALVFPVVAAFGYGLDATSALVICGAVLSGGFAILLQAGLKRAQQFTRAALLSQSSNLTLLLAALVMAAGFGRVAWFPMAAAAVVFATGAWLAWRWLRASFPEGQPMRAALWRDALQFAGITIASEALIQMERFLIPVALSLEELAVFAVLAAVAIAPFRMLELGVDMTLTARIRAAAGADERRALVRREARLLLPVCAAAAAVVLAVGRPLCELVLAREGGVSEWLLLAAVVSGAARVAAAVGRALAGALCTGRELRTVSLAAWIGLAVGAAGGWALAAFGLIGVIYGVALGWMTRALPALWIARRHLRARGGPGCPSECGR